MTDNTVVIEANLLPVKDVVDNINRATMPRKPLMEGILWVWFIIVMLIGIIFVLIPFIWWFLGIPPFVIYSLIMLTPLYFASEWLIKY